MQDESTPEKTDPENPDAEASQPAADHASPNALADLQQKLAAAEARADENWERCLRATAEQDNIRKRAEREVDSARRFALERFAQDLLRVRDSLELGLKAAREAEAGAKHIEGTELTLKMLVETMSRHGIEPIDPAGAAFDPAQHEAMSAIPTNEAAPKTVKEGANKEEADKIKKQLEEAGATVEIK